MSQVLVVRSGDVFQGKKSQYRVERTISQGAIGVILLATNLADKDSSKVAIKCPKRKDLNEHILFEGTALSRIGPHPNVAGLIDINEPASAFVFLVLEHITGPTIARLLNCDISRKLRVANQMALVLEAAHKAGVVHGDFSPHNAILVRNAPRQSMVKVVDWGLGLFSQENSNPKYTCWGKYHYMSPEISRRELLSVDKKSDQYSFGCTLYKLFTGLDPLRGGEEDICQKRSKGIAFSQPIVNALEYKHKEIDPSLAHRIASIVCRSVAAASQDRFDSMTDVRIALEGLLSFAGWE